MTRRIRWQLGVVFAMAVAGSSLAVPANAQFFDDRYPSAQRFRQRFLPREFFPFPFFGDRGFGERRSSPPPRPMQPVEATRPPPPAPRKQETPAANTVLVIGDSLADWLAYGLEEAFADTPETAVVRRIRPSSGLVRYDVRGDSPDWWQAAKEMLAAESPTAIVVMLGLNDRQLPLHERAPAKAKADSSGPSGSETSRQAAGSPAAAEAQHGPPGANYEFQTDKWGELYGKRIDEMIAVLKAKGVPVLWVGLPALRGTRPMADASYLDELYRAHAEKDGIIYVNVWDGFVDEAGRYAVQGPDFEGQIRRLRTGDGINFTKAGAVKLAHYVEHELQRVLSNRLVSVALPGPDEPSKAGKAGPRPEVGPVVPLNAGSAAGTDLLGGVGHPSQAAADPIASRVLSRGDAIPAPVDRADDFSWPRAAADAADTPDTSPPAVAAPAPGPVEGATKNATKDANRSGAKKEPAPTPTKPHAQLNGVPPRPPLPVAQ